MRSKKTILQNVDAVILILYGLFIVIGLMEVYAVHYSEGSRLFNLHAVSGKQMTWMCISIIAGFSILAFDSSFFTKLAPLFYVLMLLLLAVTVVFARDINGARSWLQIGSFQFQPAEFGKMITALMLAKFLSNIEGKPRSLKNKLLAYCIIGIPMGIIILQSDMGSALVYASLIIVVFREGFPINEVVVAVLVGLCFIFSLIFDHVLIIYTLSAGIWCYVLLNSMRLLRKERKTGILFLLLFSAGILMLIASMRIHDAEMPLRLSALALVFLSWLSVRRQKQHKVWWPVVIYLLLGAFVVYGSDFIMHDVLKPYQSNRILTLVGKMHDSDASYNTVQSQMTIGSGGLTGKGYLKGTLTQSNQVPEQSTDFIFCTIGEEFGFIGTSVFLLLYLIFILRIIYIAERQRSAFSRVYAYCVASIFFLQVMINVGMTIALIPVIGIPLPFISYGGSSVLAFSIMIFIMLRLDADRLLILR